MKNLLILFTAIFSFSLLNAQESASTLPSVQVKTMDGRSFNTADLQNDGKPMIINFWATWCGPCQMMAPAYEQAARALTRPSAMKRGLMLVGFCMCVSPSPAQCPLFDDPSAACDEADDVVVTGASTPHARRTRSV